MKNLILIIALVFSGMLMQAQDYGKEVSLLGISIGDKIDIENKYDDDDIYLNNSNKAVVNEDLALYQGIAEITKSYDNVVKKVVWYREEGIHPNARKSIIFNYELSLVIDFTVTEIDGGKLFFAIYKGVGITITESQVLGFKITIE